MIHSSYGEWQVLFVYGPALLQDTAPAVCRNLPLWKAFSLPSLRAARAKADVRTFLAHMSEVEIVDAFTAVEKQLLLDVHAHARSGARSSAPPSCAKLRADLRVLYDALPRDMQQLLLFTPQRAALLQGSREPSLKVPGRVSLTRENSTMSWSDTQSNRSTSPDANDPRVSPLFSGMGSPLPRYSSVPSLNLERT